MTAVAIRTTIPGYIRLDQAAEIIGVSHSTVWRYVQDGLLDCMKIGNTHMVVEKQVRKFKRPEMGRPRIRTANAG